MERLLPWLRRTGWAYALAALALLAVAWRLGPGGAGSGDGGQPSAVAGATVAATVDAPPRPEGLVHVVGAVRRPGVYPIAPGARVVGAIRRAGGPTARADLSALNLAAAVVDGQQIVVPRRAPAGTPAATPSPVAPAAGPISLASADAAALEELDGIGPALAARIVEWRDAHGGFTSVDQLLEVPGIGPARLEALRTRVVP